MRFSILIVLLGFLTACSKSDDPKPGTGSPNNPPPTFASITLKRGSQETPYNKLNEVPWADLQPGDIVYIPYRTEPYREKIVISQSGTSTDPIRIVGIANASGQLPVIEGEGSQAVEGEHPGYKTESDLYTRSLVCIGNRPAASGNWGRQPKHIRLENLEIRKAHPDYKYKAYDGSLKNFDSFTAGIWVDRVSDLRISNCVVHDCGTGIFVNSRAYDEPQNADVSTDIILESNHFYNNGVVGSYLEHNTYVEAIGVTYMYNRYMPLRSGALGSTLKDRSAGTVVKYNWLEGSQRVLDLVEAEESAKVTTQSPDYKRTFVYGNIIHNGSKGAVLPIHYGGDKYNYSKYRRGVLYFYHNTIINQSDQLSEPAGRYYTILFQLPSKDETGNAPVEEVVDCRNNIIYNTSLTPGSKPADFYLTNSTGNLVFGPNWISSGFKYGYGNYVGSVSGDDALIVGDANNDPGFLSFSELDFGLAANSPAVDKAGDLHAEAKGSHSVTQEYKLHRSATDKKMTGSKFDLGALEKK